MSRILVIEDNDDVRTGFCEILRGAGFESAGAKTGAEGLARLHEPEPTDAILLDLTMPVMDGWEFRRQQLSVPAFAKIPVVVVTAVSPERADPASFDADAFLVKPVLPEKLIGTFREVLESHRARRTTPVEAFAAGRPDRAP